VAVSISPAGSGLLAHFGRSVDLVMLQSLT